MGESSKKMELPDFTPETSVAIGAPVRQRKEDQSLEDSRPAALCKSSTSLQTEMEAQDTREREKLTSATVTLRGNASSKVSACSPLQPARPEATVQFRTVLHSDWKYSPHEGHRVYICFGSRTEGRWNFERNCVEMVPESEVVHGKPTVVQGKLKLPRRFPDNVPYLYVVEKPNKKRKTVTGIFESLRLHGRHGTVVRVLKLPQRHAGVHCQCDLVVRPEHGYFSRLQNWRGRLFNDRVASLSALAPEMTSISRASTSETHAEDIKIMTFLDVVRQITKVSVGEICDDQLHFSEWTVEEAGKGNLDMTGTMCNAMVMRVLGPAIQSLVRDTSVEPEDRIVSGVALSVLLYHLKLTTSVAFETVKALLRIIQLQVDVAAEMCSACDVIGVRFTDTNVVVSALQLLVSVALQSPSPGMEWISVIALLHFFLGSSKPFCPIQYIEWNVIRGPSVFAWFGLSEMDPLTKEDEDLRMRCTRWLERFSDDECNNVQDLFQADLMLPRTMAWMLQLERLPEFLEGRHPLTSEDTLIVLVLRLNRCSDVVVQRFILKCAKKLEEVLKQVAEQASESRPKGDRNLAKIVADGTVAGRMLLGHIANVCHKEEFCLLMRCAVDAILAHVRLLEPDVMDSGSSERGPDHCRSTAKPDRSVVLTQFHLTASLVASWIRRLKCERELSLCTELQILNQLVACDELSKDLQRIWQRAILSHMERDLCKISDREYVTCLAEVKDDSLCLPLERCLKARTKDAVQRLSEVTIQQIISSGRNYLQKDRFVHMLDTFLATRQRDLNLRSLFSFCLWKVYFHLYDNPLDGDRYGIVQSRAIVQKAFDILANTVDAVLKGSIAVDDLKFVLAQGCAFPSLAGLLPESVCQHNVVSIKRVLIERADQLKSLEEEQEAMNCFLMFLKSLLPHVATSGIESFLEKNPSCHRINDVVVGVRGSEGKFTVLLYKDVPSDLRDFSKNFSVWQESAVFLNLCYECGGQLRDQSLLSEGRQCTEKELVREVVVGLCQPVTFKWLRVCTLTRNASITLGDLRRILEVIDICNDQQLRKELLVIHRETKRKGKEDWIDERIKQIHCFLALKRGLEVGQVILSVRAVLNLLGDFGGVAQMCDNFVGKEFLHMQLNSIPLQTTDVVRSLVQVSERQLQCLKAFCSGETKDLIYWLQTDFKGLSNLRTFVEVSLNKVAKESSFYTEVLDNLNSVATAFAPLLFTIDKSAGFGELMAFCKTVFEHLATLDNVEKKLISCAQSLDDLKLALNSLGDSKAICFKKLELITSEGTFHVGCLSTGISPIDAQRLSIEDVMKLEMPHQPCYSLSDLLELQSQLILMSGRREDSRYDSVEAFVTLFEQVQSLSEYFVALCREGNFNYFQWKASFEMGPVESITYNKTLHVIKERITSMQQELESWKKEKVNLRSQYYLLTYYTTSQLLFISYELGKILEHRSRTIQVDDSILMLLEAVNSRVSSDDVADALSTVLSGETKLRVQREEPLSSRSRSIVSAGSRKMGLFRRTDRSTKVTVLNGYINISSVGEFLEHLSRSTTLIAQRELPPGLVAGQPNLIVVPEPNILPTLIGLYMYKCDGSNQSMPSPQEVFWCSTETTAEEVITFWQRAIFDVYGRVFSFVAAGSLSFEIGRQSSIELLRLCSDSIRDVGKFRLVIFCSKQDGRRRSPIASYLNEYRRSPPSCPSEAEIQLYLKSQLVKEVHTSQQRSAPLSTLVDGENYSVLLVSSGKSGAGKSTLIGATARQLPCGSKHRATASSKSCSEEQCRPCIVTSLHGKCVKVDTFVSDIREICQAVGLRKLKTVHVDVSPFVRQGLDRFLFSLVLLRQVVDSSGIVWRRRETEYYRIEWCETPSTNTVSVDCREKSERTSFTSYLPCIRCGSPRQLLEDLLHRVDTTIPIHIASFLDSDIYQRAFHYLRRRNTDIGSYQYAEEREKNHTLSLQTVLGHCAANTDDPSWADVKHYVGFLSYQLQSMDNSNFCVPESLECLPGFKNFVLEFMIRMSRDFTEPSLNMRQKAVVTGGCELDQYQLCRTWEKSNHPYLFFNKDRTTFSFVGIVIGENGHLIDPADRNRDLGQIMTLPLRDALLRQKCNLQEDYRQWNREKRLSILGSVMGVTDCSTCDDPSFQVTNDNMMKMLAIETRFQCGIPVILLGETGCGKTRLIQFMCKLKAGARQEENLCMKKIHGGVTRREIVRFVEKAELMAIDNAKHGTNTILFFDEANTTEHIDLIKEIICDNRMNGRLVKAIGDSLQVVAACNPYRSHQPDMIRKLEAAGLGYATQGKETNQTIGETPLRHLVYRVQPLPESMRRFVWDFGQLKPETEKLYIEQLVKHFLECTISISNVEPHLRQVTDVLAASQAFMRQKQDECSFVSIRDVKRTLSVAKWFYEMHEILKPLLDDARIRLSGSLWKLTRKRVSLLATSIVLALGVCYHARLQDRHSYRNCVYKILRLAPLALAGGPEVIENEIRLCQEVFLDQMKLPPGIGRSRALCENVFMMVVCINLQIPLFLVGKPGSSKNLAKDIIKATMRDAENKSTLFRQLKQVQVLSYQCSKKSTAPSIIKLFQSAERIQETHDSNAFTACVVLDEVGLAEDSPHMPLKALHPLLDEGTRAVCCLEDSKSTVSSSPNASPMVTADAIDSVRSQVVTKISFMGISNWALDPAKMNRGVLVNREIPDEDDLTECSLGICSGDKDIQELLKPSLRGLAKAYLRVYHSQDSGREFYGLRDFYSLVKLLYCGCRRSGEALSWPQLEYAVKRNFDEQNDCYIKAFRDSFPHLARAQHFQSLASSKDFIQDNLSSREDEAWGNRYLLLLTENNAALQILRQGILTSEEPEIIYGSCFRNDQGYTDACQQLRRIKVCMATGRTVILLNLDKVYEGLYDVLNQYYMHHDGRRFVDMGLGSDRVTCQVHRNFRAVIIAEQEHVHQTFPIALISRLEKHYLGITSVLSASQMALSRQLSAWAKGIEGPVTGRRQKDSDSHLAKVFIGYRKDTPATIIMTVVKEVGKKDEKLSQQEYDRLVFTRAYSSLLQIATPETFVCRRASEHFERIQKEYFNEQEHFSLAKYLSNLQQDHSASGLLVQVATSSRLIPSETKLQVLEKQLKRQVTVTSLDDYDTERKFSIECRKFYRRIESNSGYLLIHCDSLRYSTEMISFIVYIIEEEKRAAAKQTISRSMGNVVIVIYVPRDNDSSVSPLIGPTWRYVYIDDVYRDAKRAVSVSKVMGKSIASVMAEARMLLWPDLTVPTERSITESMASRKASLDIETVLLESMHTAVSRIDDPRQQSTRRINTILLLIDRSRNRESGSQSFVTVLVDRVVTLLKAEENRVGSEEAASWVQSTGEDLPRLQEAGTFSEALWRKVIGVVTPILSEIIAYIDVDNNLEVAVTASVRVQCLWLDFFSTSSITSLKHEDFSSLENRTLRQRVPVASYGFGGHHFNALFPFSCRVKSRVDDMLTEAASQARQLVKKNSGQLTISSVKTEILRRIFDRSDIGDHFLKFETKSPDDSRCLIKCYLNDFVHMVYNPVSEDANSEIRMVSIALENEITSTQRLDIPSIHSIFQDIKPFVDSLQTMLTYGTRLENSLLAQQLIERCTTETPSGMVLDAICATLLTSSCSPVPAIDFSDWSLCKQWLKRVKLCRLSVDEWSQGNQEHLNHQRQSLLDKARWTWMRILAVCLFLDHTSALCPQHSQFVLTTANTLWKKLDGEKVDFTTERTVSTVYKQLSQSESGTLRKNLTSTGIAGSYLRRCESYFFELVTGHSFRGEIEESLVQLFLEIVFQRKLTWFRRKFQTDVANPVERRVVRSFLLKLLLKHRQNSTEMHLEQYFKQCSVPQKGFDDELGVGEMFVHCMEDMQAEESQDFAIMLQEAADLLRSHKTAKRVSILRGIAKARIGLEAAADVINDHISVRGQQRRSGDAVPPKKQEILKKAAKLCCATDNEEVSLFLLKHLVRKFGMQVLQQLEDVADIKWLDDVVKTKGLGTFQTTPDCFLVVGDHYPLVRKEVTRFFVTGQVDSLKRVEEIEHLQHFPNLLVVTTLLAIYRRMSIATRQSSAEQTNVKSLLEKTSWLPLWAKHLAVQLVLQRSELNVLQKRLGPAAIHGRRMHMDVCIHSVIAVQAAGSCDLLKALHIMATNPLQLQASYLPTMKSDRFEEVTAAVTDVTAWYVCPNNHRYGIGDCGKAWWIGKCPECNEPIGGQAHKLLSSNRQADQYRYRSSADETGYILEKGGRRRNDTPERELNRQTTAMIRILMHSCLIWASCYEVSAKGLQQLISSRLNVGNVSKFLWTQMLHDLGQLSEAMACGGQEDVFIVLHMLNSHIASLAEKKFGLADPLLKSNNARMVWERMFVQNVLTPVLQSLRGKVTDQRRKILTNQEHMGRTDLMEQIYEHSAPCGSHALNKLWRYRTKIDIDHLSRTLDQSVTDPNKYPILRGFLRKEPQLRLLLRLPAILELHGFLRSKLHRQISRRDARILTLRDLKQQLRSVEERQRISRLIEDLSFVWKQARYDILKFGGLWSPRQEQHQLENMDENTPIGYFLPSAIPRVLTDKELEGICFLALVHHLVETVNNDFVRWYRNIVGAERELNEIEVPLNQVTTAHLVTFDYQRELLPLILSHCDCSSMDTESGKVEAYDFEALEKQIAERFICYKPVIQFKPEKLRFGFFTDVCRKEIHKNLMEKVQQEEMLTSVGNQVIEQLTDVASLSSVIGVLDDVIGIASSAGPGPDVPIVEYLHEVLHFPPERSIISPTARVQCQLKHVRSLWRLLNVEKGRRLMRNQAQPFEVPDRYRERLPQPAVIQFKLWLHRTDIDMFLKETTDIVLLWFEEWEDVPYMMDLERGSDIMEDFCESQLRGLQQIPKEVKLCHILHCWKIATRMQGQMTTS